jgi:hypothetical protein
MASDKDTGRGGRTPLPAKRSSQPSFSPSSEPGITRLGGSGTPERPLRAQLVIGGVIALILVAVPLYLLRRPAPVSAPVAADSGPSTRGFGVVVHTAPDAGARTSEVTLGPVQRVRCGSSPRTLSEEGGLCDALPGLEKALARSIQKHTECAPQGGKGGSLNYVLEVDFDRRHVGMFAGKSGTLKGPRARSAAQCVLRSLGPVDWDGTRHQYRYYAIAFLATYPTPDPLEELPTFD